MNYIQPITTRRRKIPRLSDFGSPFKLMALVSDLNERDLGSERALRLQSSGTLKMRASMASICIEHIRYYLALLTLASVQRHYLSRIGLSPQNPVLDEISAGIAENKELAQASAKIATLSDTSSYTARTLAGQKVELEELRYDGDLYDPKNTAIGEAAFELYRRGLWLEKEGRPGEAEAMYMLALKTDPSFAAACRQVAGIVRKRDPSQAAALYSAALDYMPHLNYGHPGNISIAGVRLEVQAAYRDFLIFEYSKRAFAVPAILGTVDLQDPKVRSRLNRFAGLYVLRLRLAMRRFRLLAESVEGDKRVARDSSFLAFKRAIYYIGRPLLHMAAYVLLPIAKIFKRPISAVGRPLLSMADRSITWLSARSRQLVRSAALRARGIGIALLVRRRGLFNFILIDKNIDRMKEQIDLVHSKWLSANVDVPAHEASANLSDRPVQ